MLFVLGSNGSGQLGLGHEDDVSVPTQVCDGEASSKKQSNTEIKRIAAGGNHTVLLYTDGTAFATGNNEDGRCNNSVVGSYSQVTQCRSPSIDATSGPKVFDDVAATWSATIFSSNEGTEVWSCGSGYCGDLGLGEGVTKQTTLRQIVGFPPAGTRVVQLASCMAHVVAVLSTGEVYGWGKGRKGQLGEPAVAGVWAPRKIEGIPFSAVKAVCGKDCTCVVGDARAGNYILLGPSGNDRFGMKVSAPSDTTGWRDIQASWGSIYVVKESGKLVAWGRDDHGQLPPPNLSDITYFAAGSEHCVALTATGKVLAWGWGEHGNCGQPTDEKGDVKARWNELDVQGKPTRVFAGCATSFILTQAG